MSENNNGIMIQRKHIVIAAIAILLLIAGGVAVGLNWGKWFGDDSSSVSGSVSEQDDRQPIDLDPNAGKYTGEKPEDKGGAAKGIKIPGYPSITIAKDTQDVRMALLNPEGNPCYFKFVIVLKDTDEVIFESKYVEPGKAISSVHLNRPLEAGEYKATIKITTVSLDGKTPLNGANVETKLIAK